MSLPFDLYARYYDLLYREKDYAAESAHVAAAIARRAPGARRILELGCGTGGHAEHLARAGYTVHGVDLSDGMIAGAGQRRAALPPEVAARLSFATGDARSVRAGAGFDAVISLFHVMSYQTGNADLRAVYDTAGAHLAPGGLFLYDYWFGPAVLSQAPEARVRRLADDRIRVTRIAEPVMHWARNVCDVNYTLFIEAVDGRAVHQVRETHSMRYLFLPELELIEGGAWTGAEDSAWLSDRAPDAGSWAALRSVVKA